MRLISLFVSVLIISSCLSFKISMTEGCPKNFKIIIRDMYALLNSGKVTPDQRINLLEKVRSLVNLCDTPTLASIPVESLGASTQECDQWRKRVELLKKLIQDPYTRTDRVLGEYAETLNRIKDQC